MPSPEPSHEALWVREGDLAREYWPDGWGPLASFRTPQERSQARVAIHGFDFRIESARGQKRMVKIPPGTDSGRTSRPKSG